MPDNSPLVNVLIVEDNAPDVYLLRSAMTGEYKHCAFDVIENGRDAFRFLRREEPFRDAALPDLVVLDLNLPFRSGEEVLDLIRMTDSLRHIVVVLCSSAPEYRSRSPHVPDGYIAKPFDLESWRALGKEILGCYWSKRGLGAAAPGASAA